MSLQITYFDATPQRINWLVSYQAYNSCWICKRLHFPLNCSEHNIQMTWQAIHPDTLLFFRFSIASRYHCVCLQQQQQQFYFFYLNASTLNNTDTVRPGGGEKTLRSSRLPPPATNQQ